MPSATRRALLLVAALIASLLGTNVKADSPAGAWSMIKYEGAASHGAATGLLLLVDGHFSLTYTMDEGGQRWGRAHAGTYSVAGNRLTFHVGWSMEYVAGKPSVAPKPSDREVTFVLNDSNTLTITFSNGSVQTFKKTS